MKLGKKVKKIIFLWFGVKNGKFWQKKISIFFSTLTLILTPLVTSQTNFDWTFFVALEVICRMALVSCKNSKKWLNGSCFREKSQNRQNFEPMGRPGGPKDLKFCMWPTILLLYLHVKFQVRSYSRFWVREGGVIFTPPACLILKKSRLE